MKQFIILISIILFLTSQIQAQVPGYQGKRFFIELGTSLFFNLGAPIAQNKGPQSFPFNAHTGHFTIKDRYSLSIHYIIGRKSTFKLAYNYQVSGLNTSTKTPSLFNNGFDEHDLFYQLHMNDLNLGVNLYGRKSNSNLAPIGFYWDLGLRFLFVDGVLRDQRVTYADNRQDNYPNPEELAPLTENTFMFMLGITAMWGYRTVIADRLILNFGIEFTFFPQYPIGLGVPGLPGGVSALTDYQRGVVRNAQDRYLLSLHIGVGALLF
jgi:hypothetical protein